MPSLSLSPTAIHAPHTIVLPTPFSFPPLSCAYVSYLLQSVIKLRIAPKLALLPATTAVWKATSLGTVPKKPKQSHATSAVKKAISPAIAPITQPRLGEAIPAVVEEEALNAINVARSDTLRVRALSRLELVVEEEVVDMEAEEEVIMERLVVVRRRLATLAVV